jgi:hypothetical protein
MKKMSLWEYKIIRSTDVKNEDAKWYESSMGDREAVEAHLNALGEEGWEIVGIDFTDAQVGSTVYFHALAKRPLR